MRKDDSFTLGTRYFFLACDEELRRLQADTSSAEDFLRLERNRKPRMKSLWHPGYDSFGTIPFFFYFLQSNIVDPPSPILFLIYKS